MERNEATEIVRSGRRSRWSWAFVLLLAGVLLFLALRGMNWREVLGTLRHARLEYLALVGLVASSSYLVRALRWRVLLGAEKQLPPLTVFWATMAGYLGNSVLPARAGELVRSVLLGRRAAISASFVLATALTERIVDAVVLVLIGSLSLLWLERAPQVLIKAIRPMAVLGLVGLAGVLVAPRLQSGLQRALNRLPLAAGRRERLSGLLAQFLLGMRALQHAGRAAGFLALTAAVWLADALGTMVAARALNLALTPSQALLLLAALGLASAVPSTPGYIGVYQLVAVTVLPLFDVSRSQALAYIMVSQALSYCVLTTWGLLGLWQLGAKEVRDGLH